MNPPPASFSWRLLEFSMVPCFYLFDFTMPDNHSFIRINFFIYHGNDIDIFYDEDVLREKLVNKMQSENLNQQETVIIFFINRNEILSLELIMGF